MWIPSEVKQPVLYQSPKRKSIGNFGAVRMTGGKHFTKKERGMGRGVIAETNGHRTGLNREGRTIHQNHSLVFSPFSLLFPMSTFTYLCPVCNTLLTRQKRRGSAGETVRTKYGLPQELFDLCVTLQRGAVGVCRGCVEQFRFPYKIYVGPEKEDVLAMVLPSKNFTMGPPPRPRPRPLLPLFLFFFYR